MNERGYDFVIIGAGSAGCVLARRLSARRDMRVLLLEAGASDFNPFIHMPAGLAQLADNRRLNWNYYTEPERELLGRRLYWPRGRVLGGSSSINAMCYTRGHPLDYDEWSVLAGAGWSYEAVLPYFRRAEDQARGADQYHGVGGPLSVEDLKFRNPLSAVFVDAAEACGVPRNPDFNGAQQEGGGFYQVTQRNGQRCSSARAYLHSSRRQNNLEVKTRCMVARILIEHGRATGVEYWQRGAKRIARADCEVLLAAGSIASPQILMLSGVGPSMQLMALGIKVTMNLPQVGQNLQDHLDFCTLHQCTQPITYDFNRLQEVGVGLRYLLTRNGPGVSNIAEAGAFIRSQLAADARPNVQLHFVPAQLDDHGRNRLPGHGYTLHACGLRPRSRGHIALRTSQADDPPHIHANYLTDSHDLKVLLEAVEISRQILNSQPFSAYRGREVFPGEGLSSAAQIEAVVRQKAETIYHPVGTCRMGSDNDSVVDPKLRVRGIEHLRVIDASVMPRLIGGNTNAPTIMIAEKAAQDILAATRGAKSPA